MTNTRTTTLIPPKSFLKISSGWIVLEPAVPTPLALTVTVTLVDVPFVQLIKFVSTQKIDPIFEK